MFFMEKEVSEAARRLALQKAMIARIDILLSEENPDAQELLRIIKEFFTPFLKLDYEFTYEELLLELDKIFITDAARAQITILLETITELTYLRGEEFSEAQIKTFLKQLRAIILTLIPEPVSDKKKGFFSRLFSQTRASALPLEPSFNPTPSTDSTLTSPVRGNSPSTTPLSTPITNDTQTSMQSLSQSSSDTSTQSLNLQTGNRNISQTAVTIDAAHSLLVESEDPQITSINMLIEQIYAARAEQHISHAQELYLKALHAYRKLPDSEKERVFLTLYTVYSALSNEL